MEPAAAADGPFLLMAARLLYLPGVAVLTQRVPVGVPASPKLGFSKASLFATRLLPGALPATNSVRLLMESMARLVRHLTSPPALARSD